MAFRLSDASFSVFSVVEDAVDQGTQHTAKNQSERTSKFCCIPLHVFLLMFCCCGSYTISGAIKHRRVSPHSYSLADAEFKQIAAGTVGKVLKQ